METWWPLRLPQRMLYVATLALVPLQFVALATEIALALVVAAAIGLLAAVYTHAIPDATTAAVMADAGKRLTEILHAQGVY